MIDKAITFATKAHEGQFRKGTKLPYIVHPLEVGVIVSRMTQDKEVIAAAILHDTLEGSNVFYTLPGVWRKSGGDCKG